MKINLQQIPPDGLHLEGVEDHDILQLEDPFIQPVSNVRYELDIGLSEDGLFATGILDVDLEMECVRCLRKFQRDLQLDAFALQIELEGTEMIDLTPTMREDIILALPAHPHCDWDGRTECPGVIPVPADKDLPDPESASPSSRWEALDQLKIQTKE